MSAEQQTERKPRQKKEKQLPPRIALSINEAAAMIGLSRWTIAAMLETGTLPGFILRTGKTKKIWRIREDALRQWITNKEAETRKSIQNESRRLQAI